MLSLASNLLSLFSTEEFLLNLFNTIHEISFLPFRRNHPVQSNQCPDKTFTVFSGDKF